MIDAVPSHSDVMILGCLGLPGLLSACKIEGKAEDFIAYNEWSPEQLVITGIIAKWLE